MCGICGIWTGAEPAEEAVRRMVGALGHRGPDGSGLWSDPAAGLTLGHARLAILDRSLPWTVILATRDHDVTKRCDTIIELAPCHLNDGTVIQMSKPE